MKRKLPSPGFQLEIVLIDCDGTIPTKLKSETTSNESDGTSGTVATADGPKTSTTPDESKDRISNDKDDVFSDSEAEEGGSVKSRQSRASASGKETAAGAGGQQKDKQKEEMASTAHSVEQVSQAAKENPNPGEMKKENANVEVPKSDLSGVSDFKAIAADASVFTFGDDEDYESE
ncbi:hypothetical protein ACLOJK_035525 [Asimina triloba]